MLPVGFSNGSGLALANRPSVSGPALNPVVAAQPKFSAKLRASIDGDTVTSDSFLYAVKRETPETQWPALVTFFQRFQELVPKFAMLGNRGDMVTVNFDSDNNTLSASYFQEEVGLLHRTKKMPLLTQDANSEAANLFGYSPESWLEEMTAELNSQPAKERFRALAHTWLGVKK